MVKITNILKIKKFSNQVKAVLVWKLTTAKLGRRRKSPEENWLLFHLNKSGNKVALQQVRYQEAFKILKISHEVLEVFKWRISQFGSDRPTPGRVIGRWAPVARQTLLSCSAAFAFVHSFISSDVTSSLWQRIKSINLVLFFRRFWNVLIKKNKKKNKKPNWI